MHIAYQKPFGASATAAHTDDLIAWCGREGLKADNIPSDHFAVIDLGSDRFVAVYREYVRDSEIGCKILQRPDSEESGYAKTDWRMREVTTAPPAFAGFTAEELLHVSKPSEMTFSQTCLAAANRTPEPQSLKALDALHAANMHGTDATTSLDTLIRRLVEIAAHEMRELSPAARNDRMVSLVGSDAVRAFTVLGKGVFA